MKKTAAQQDLGADVSDGKLDDEQQPCLQQVFAQCDALAPAIKAKRAIEAKEQDREGKPGSESFPGWHPMRTKEDSSQDNGCVQPGDFNRKLKKARAQDAFANELMHAQTLRSRCRIGTDHGSCLVDTAESGPGSALKGLS